MQRTPSCPSLFPHPPPTCISEWANISAWTAVYHLKLDLSKTALLTIPGKDYPHMDLSVAVKDITVLPSSTARNQGLILNDRWGHEHFFYFIFFTLSTVICCGFFLLTNVLILSCLWQNCLLNALNINVYVKICIYFWVVLKFSSTPCQCPGFCPLPSKLNQGLGSIFNLKFLRVACLSVIVTEKPALNTVFQWYTVHYC